MEPTPGCSSRHTEVSAAFLHAAKLEPPPCWNSCSPVWSVNYPLWMAPKNTKRVSCVTRTSGYNYPMPRSHVPDFVWLTLLRAERFLCGGITHLLARARGLTGLINSLHFSTACCIQGRLSEVDENIGNFENLCPFHLRIYGACALRSMPKNLSIRASAHKGAAPTSKIRREMKNASDCKFPIFHDDRIGMPIRQEEN